MSYPCRVAPVLYPNANAVYARGYYACIRTRPGGPSGRIGRRPAQDPDPKRAALKEISIYTDGACSGNPGPGGWAALLQFGPHERVLSGGSPQTTNNRMELQAAIEGLRALKRPSHVRLHTDSSYLQRAFTEGWLDRWQRNGWRTSSKKAVENQDLWQELLALSGQHDITWVKVKGHANDDLNNRVDGLAVAALEKYR